MSITLFLPLRKGSERVPDKNTRPFCDLENGLLELKLSQLSKLNVFDEILLSSNDEKCLDIATKFSDRIKNLKIIKRPEHLGTAETELSELIKYVGTIAASEYILWTHVTSPFFDEKCYEKVFSTFFEVEKKGYDSLITGQKFQEFLWEKKSDRIINNPTSTNWPRTQDLAEWFKIDNATFLTKATDYKNGQRLGKKPFLMESNKIQSWDIDEYEDFKIAEAIYERIYK